MVHVPTAERRRQIIEAATRVISRDGVSKATTRRICEEARANIGTLHYTFSGKDDLLEAVFAYCWDVVSEVVEEAVAASSGSDDAARQILTRYCDLAVSDPDLMAAQYQLVAWGMTRKDGRKGAESAYRQQEEILAAALRRGSPESHQDLDAADLARIIVTLLDGMCLRFVVSGSTVRLRQDLASAIALLEQSSSERSASKPAAGLSI